MLETLGYRATDAGEGYEYDLLIHSHSGVSRVQVKAMGLDGINRLNRVSQKTSGSVVKRYGSDAFDVLFLVDRSDFSGYLIPVSEIISGDRLATYVPHTKFSRYFISTKPTDESQAIN